MAGRSTYIPPAPAPVPVKSLTINWYDETKEPEIEIKGVWTMTQMNALDSLIIRAYRKHVIGMQRKDKE